MDSKVFNFLKMVNNGTDVNEAARVTGVDNMNIYLLLNEISKVFKNLDLEKLHEEVNELDAAMMDLKKVSDPDNCKKDGNFRVIQD